MGNVIGLVPSRTGIAIGRLVNAQLRACVICLAPSMRAARRHKSFLFWPQTQCRKPVNNYYSVWYFMFASGWQAENCCSLFYRAFIVNNSTLGVIPSVILNLNYLKKKIKYFSCIISEHITCIRKVCTRCSCSSCIFSANIFSDLFNI